MSELIVHGTGRRKISNGLGVENEASWFAEGERIEVETVSSGIRYDVEDLE